MKLHHLFSIKKKIIIINEKNIPDCHLLILFINLAEGELQNCC